MFSTGRPFPTHHRQASVTVRLEFPAISKATIVSMVDTEANSCLVW